MRRTEYGRIPLLHGVWGVLEWRSDRNCPRVGIWGGQCGAAVSGGGAGQAVAARDGTKEDRGSLRRFRRVLRYGCDSGAADLGRFGTAAARSRGDHLHRRVGDPAKRLITSLGGGQYGCPGNDGRS